MAKVPKTTKTHDAALVAAQAGWSVTLRYVAIRVVVNTPPIGSAAWLLHSLAKSLAII